MASAYTVFVGIGTAGTYVTGIFMGETFSGGQIFFLIVLLGGIIGMKMFTKENDARQEVMNDAMDVFSDFRNRKGYCRHRYEICRRHKKKMADYRHGVGVWLVFFLPFKSNADAISRCCICRSIKTGIGSIGITAVSLFWFKERIRAPQLISLGFIIIGVIGLRLTSS